MYRDENEPNIPDPSPPHRPNQTGVTCTREFAAEFSVLRPKIRYSAKSLYIAIYLTNCTLV